MPKEDSIGALWDNETKAGEQYFSGSIEIRGEKYKIVVFKNKYKEKDTHPDWRILPSQPRSNPPDSDIPF